MNEEEEGTCMCRCRCICVGVCVCIRLLIGDGGGGEIETYDSSQSQIASLPTAIVFIATVGFFRKKLLESRLLAF